MYDLEEQEQLDALKGWWNQYGRTVVIALAAAALAAAATAAWKWRQGSQVEQASTLYASLERAMRSNDVKQVREVAGQLMDKYGSTADASLAALAAAKVNVEAGDTKSAADQLRWVTENARADETAAVARLRLAAVMLDEKRYDEALKLLGEKHPEAFAGLYADLRGDVLVEQGKRGDARTAYTQALEKLPADGNYRVVVQIKLDALGGGN